MIIKNYAEVVSRSPFEMAHLKEKKKKSNHLTGKLSDTPRNGNFNNIRVYFK